VMGWRWKEVDFYWVDEDKPEKFLIPPPKDQIYLKTSSGSWDRDNILFDMPAYSSDMAAAWEAWNVVGHGYCMILVKRMDRIGWIWSAELNGFVHAQAKTAPHAICLAALKAVGAA